jgi:hypothetical protein
MGALDEAYPLCSVDERFSRLLEGVTSGARALVASAAPLWDHSAIRCLSALRPYRPHMNRGLEAKVIGHHANPDDQRRDVVRVTGAKDSGAGDSAAVDRRVPSL